MVTFLLPTTTLAKTQTISDYAQQSMIEELVNLLKREPDIFNKIQLILNKYKDNSDDLEAFCFTDQNPTYLGERINYTVNVSGGNSKYTYKWAGS